MHMNYVCSIIIDIFIRVMSKYIETLRKVKFRGCHVRVWCTNPDISREDANVSVFLHGSRVTPMGMEKWVKNVWSPPKDFILVMPSAPMRPYTMSKGKLKCVWHDRRALHPDHTHEDLESIDEISLQLKDLVQTLRGLQCKNLSLGGFSMGGHQAMHSVYRFGIPVEKCYSISTYLINNSAIYSSLEKCSMTSNHPLLHISHGQQDDITPLDWSQTTRDKLTGLGVACTFETWPHNKHDLCTQQMDHIMAWLRK